MHLSWKKRKKAEETELENLYSQTFCPLRCSIPRAWLPKLQAVATEKQTSVSALIASLVDKALSEPKLLDLPDLSWPETPAYENQYAAEANRLYQYMLPWGLNGLSLASLVYLRHEYNVKERETVLLAMRELYLADKIEVFTPKKGWAAKSPETEKFRIKGLTKIVTLKEKGPL